MKQQVPAGAVDGDVRTRLMRTAEHLLASSTNGQISTREICSGARVTAPTLYHHFKDKHALLDAVVLEGFTEYLDSKRAVARSDDVLEDFSRGWDMHVSFGCEHPAHYRLMFGDLRVDHTSPAAVVAQDEVDRVVSAWAAAGHLRVSAEAAKETISAAAVGVTLQLIAVRATSSHIISTNVRDTIARSVFRAQGSSGTAADGCAGSATQLLDALPNGPWKSLRPTEVALLREWLAVLADRPR
ncbi:TetR/AcrR family transcriptional regulator [Actinomycetospora sp. OC33-EN08]|uniref:TetR/AcrR family transcriptional regulator n=1 Tax=Actinomycetospora aurantiaca TaxID=3129233 RepID=A0ABU8MVA3_9PSEU